jgi:hypothetical protein
MSSCDNIDLTYNVPPQGRTAHASLFTNFVGAFLSKRHQGLQIEHLENHFVSLSGYISIRHHLTVAALKQDSL